MRNIYKKEELKGLVESLHYGTSDGDFFRLLEDKLGVTQSDFDQYIKAEAKKYKAP